MSSYALQKLRRLLANCDEPKRVQQLLVEQDVEFGGDEWRRGISEELALWFEAQAARQAEGEQRAGDSVSQKHEQETWLTQFGVLLTTKGLLAGNAILLTVLLPRVASRPASRAFHQTTWMQVCAQSECSIATAKCKHLLYRARWSNAVLYCVVGGQKPTGGTC